MAASTTRTTISFSKTFFKRAKAQADQKGITFPELVRYAVLHYIDQDQNQREPVYYLSDETEKAVKEGMKEYREGKTTSYKSGTDLIRGVLNKKEK